MNGQDADDRWDPEIQGPAPTGWPTPPPPRRERRETVYARGAAACRAILREKGVPEHGPAWLARHARDAGAES